MNHAPNVELGDKFGESLEGSHAPPSFWEVPDFPRSSPNFPGSFSATSPEVPHCGTKQQSRGSPEVSRTSPEVPQTSLEVSLSLGSLTPSPDSQKLSLLSAHITSAAGPKALPNPWKKQCRKKGSLRKGSFHRRNL